MCAISIRRSETGDAAELAGLSVELGYPTSTTQSANRLSGILDSPDHLVLVACGDDAAIVGWVHVFLARRVESDCFAELGGFVVAAHHRRRGVGKTLLAAAEDWARDRGVEKLRVRSRADRFDARRFYEGLGFSSTKKQNVFDKPLRTRA